MKKLKPKKITRPMPEVYIAKWSANVLDEGFTPLPKRLLRCMSRIFKDPHAIEHLAVIMAVVDYRRPDLMRLPSIKYLSALAGTTVEQFRERLQELVDNQLVTREGSDELIEIGITPLLTAIEKETRSEA